MNFVIRIHLFLVLEYSLVERWTFLQKAKPKKQKTNKSCQFTGVHDFKALLSPKDPDSGKWRLN